MLQMEMDTWSYMFIPEFVFATLCQQDELMYSNLSTPASSEFPFDFVETLSRIV